MSEPVEAPEAPPAPRVHVAREAAFQRVAVEFIRRVVEAPMFLTAIAHENELSQNARARAKARGVAGGVPDLYLAQAPQRSAWMELKWGPNRPSDAQKHVAGALGYCGISHGFCWTIHDVLRVLRTSEFILHGNAANIATEYQERAEAAVARAELNAGTRTKATLSIKPRGTRKGTPAQHKRITAARMGWSV